MPKKHDAPPQRRRRLSAALEEWSWEWGREWTADARALCGAPATPRQHEFSQDDAIQRAWSRRVAAPANETLCRDGSGFPRALSRLLAQGVRRATFSVTRGKWRDERWPEALASVPVGPPGAHVDVLGGDLAVAHHLAKLLGAGASFTRAVVREDTDHLRATDAHEDLCGTHVAAFQRLLLGRPSLSEASVLGDETTFASLATSIERVDRADGAPLWRWRLAATAVKRSSQQQRRRQFDEKTDGLAVRLHLAVESKLAGSLVVHLDNPGRCRAALRVPVPWFFEFVEDSRSELPSSLEHGTRRLETEDATFRAVFRYRARLLNDAHWPYDQFRGFEVPPAYATCRNHTAFSEAALVLLPEHDRPMVFNVITIYSTILAFVFGAVMTSLVRKSPQKKKKTHRHHR
mmetsp:Transcript_19664/g.60819  ORF Transcript_19664/g.60819 Transcript_19664/m.60819 type:complete len:404 (+) Transcript_19664:161-1372(+)